MSEMETEVSESHQAEPGEGGGAAPLMESANQVDTCAGSAQAPTPAGTKTAALDSREAPVLTSSPTADSGFAEAAQSREQEKEGDTEIRGAAPLRTQDSQRLLSHLCPH